VRENHVTVPFRTRIGTKVRIRSPRVRWDVNRAGSIRLSLMRTSALESAVNTSPSETRRLLASGTTRQQSSRARVGGVHAVALISSHESHLSLRAGAEPRPVAPVIHPSASKIPPLRASIVCGVCRLRPSGAVETHRCGRGTTADKADARHSTATGCPTIAGPSFIKDRDRHEEPNFDCSCALSKLERIGRLSKHALGVARRARRRSDHQW
jgi:hypothetical protein